MLFRSKNCGLCLKACPRHIITMVPKPGAKPVAKPVEKPAVEKAPEVEVKTSEPEEKPAE